MNHTITLLDEENTAKLLQAEKELERLKIKKSRIEEKIHNLREIVAVYEENQPYILRNAECCREGLFDRKFTVKNGRTPSIMGIMLDLSEFADGTYMIRGTNKMYAGNIVLNEAIGVTKPRLTDYMHMTVAFKCHSCNSRVQCFTLCSIEGKSGSAFCSECIANPNTYIGKIMLELATGIERDRFENEHYERKQCMLLSRHKRSDSPFSQLPLDIFKVIWNIVFHFSVEFS